MNKIILIWPILIINIICADAQIIDNKNVDSVLIGSVKRQDDFGLKILRKLSQHIDKTILDKTPKGGFYAVCLALSMNEKGKVETVYTSLNLSSTIKQFLKPKSLPTTMQELPAMANQYKNKTVIVPVMFVRAYTESIQLNSEFIDSMNNLWPDFPPDKSRPVILLSPQFYRFGYPVRH